MIANVSKTNTGKLLVAVLAMFMIVAGAAVVLSNTEVSAVEPSGVPAEPTWADAKTVEVDDVSDFGASSGVITISEDTVFKLTADIGSATAPVDVAFELKADMKITANDGCELYIKSTAGQTIKISATGVYFEVDGATVTLDGNAEGNTVLNTNASDVTGVFKVCNGGVLNITHTKGASTLAVANTHETYVVVDNATLNIDGANAFQVPLFVLNKADVNVSASEVATAVGGYVDATDSTIDITDSNTFSMLLFSADLTNSKITADKPILFYGNGATDSKYTGYAVNTIILDATSSITAPEYNFSQGWGSTPAITANSTVTFEGEGTVNGDFKVPTGSQFIGAYNFNNVKINGSTTGVTTVETSEDGTSATINPVEGTEIDANLVSGAFSDSKVNTVTISSGTVPASGLDLTNTVTSGDTVVLGSDVEITSGATFKIPVGVSIEYSTSVPTGTEHTFTVTAGGSSAGFKNFSGDFSVTGGSIVVSGTGTGIIEAADGSEVEFTGNVSGNIQVSWTNDSVTSGKVIFDNATISSNCTITLDPIDKISYSVNGELRVYGKILNSTAGTDSISAISIKVEGKNAVKAYASATIGNGVYFMGDGNIDLGSSMSTGYWSEDIASDMTWSQAQKTIIDGSMTIKSGYTLTVLGELVIDEGVTVYIEDGATLKIGQTDGATAVGITVNGTIEVAQGGTFDVQNAKDVTVTGQLYSEGIVDISSNVTVKSGGSIVIDESYDETSASKITVEKGLTIEAGGSITISSEMTITEINNKGTVNLVDAILAGTSKSTIYQAADGAVVNIDSITGAQGASDLELVVTDSGLVFEKDKNGIEKKVTDESNAFSVKVSYEKGIAGIVITESVTSEKTGDVTKYSNSMYISGNVTAVNQSASATSDNTTAEFTIRGDGSNDGGFYIGAEDTLTLGAGVTMNIKKSTVSASASSKLYVEGSLTATATNSVIKYLDGTGSAEVYVSGTVTTLNGKTAIEDCINAFHYTGTDTNKYEYYTTLANALAASKDIEYIGDVSVLENTTIPADTKVSAVSGATLTVGDEDNRDVVLTVANGGVLRNGKEINVNGTFVFENNKDGNKGNTIYSDVQIDENPKMTFTNVYTALNNATTGKVEIRQDADVILNSDIEVKEGVTLVIPDSATVTMYNGVTLTVNGTVENSGNIGNAADPESGDAAAGFNPMKGDETNTDASKIVVNGAFKSMDYTAYDAYYIPGAYYQIIDTDGSWYWITPVEDAAVVAADVDDGIAIYGEVTVGDVTFAGSTEEGADAVAITVNGKLTAGTITLANATFAVPANAGQYNGTIATAVGSIEFVNVRNISVADTTDANDNEIMTLAGTPVKADSKGADATVAVATGNVTVVDGLTIETYDEEKNTDGLKSFTVVDAATVTVMDANGTQGELKADNLTVNGTLVAIDGGNVNVTGTLTVRGTFTVAEKTDDNTAGTASVCKLLIGIAVNDGKYGDASAAAVNADNIDKLASVVMSAESTFSGKQVESMKPTEFYLEDALWITAYAGTQADNIVTAATGSETSPTYNFQPADMNESKFVAWNDKDGKAITATTDVGQIDAVYADIQYDVFKVVITLDNTVGSVAIDGQMLVYDGELGGYVLPNDQLLTAGQHTVTYTLAANYEGTPTLSSQNVTVSGLTFTLSGDFENSNGKTINYYLSLGGATLADTSIVIDGGSGDDGMSLTDILLIVLVVLILVMAIIVALRLMRS